MKLTRRKKDANHDAVADAWRRFGWIVVDTSAVGSNAVPGFPDLLCIRWPVVLLVEVKDGPKAVLTLAEKAFAARAGSPPYLVCHSVEDAIEQAQAWR